MVEILNSRAGISEFRTLIGVPHGTNESPADRLRAHGLGHRVTPDHPALTCRFMVGPDQAPRNGKASPLDPEEAGTTELRQGRRPPDERSLT